MTEIRTDRQIGETGRGGAEAEQAGVTRCGFVAIIGPTNAGKSTLLNQLVGGKVSIVSHKVQTTRMRIRAISVVGPAQIIYVDTPGIFAPRRRLDRAMIRAAWAGAEDADIDLLVIDATRGRDDNGERTLEGLRRAGRRAVLALNKVDLVRKEELLELAAQFKDEPEITDIFMISALSGDGVADLRDHLAARLPAGPWLYPPDQIADLPERLLSAEITREKIYQRLHQELPYASTVETETWKALGDGSLRIEQVIYVRRESQRKIVLGKGGQAIKTIGQLARTEMEQAFGRRVHLFLYVKVRERWDEDPERYRALGLDFAED